MFYKIVYGKIVIDVGDNPIYLRYVKSSKRYRETDKTSANAIFSSDYSEKYHIAGRDDIADGDSHKDVTIVEIDEPEYNNIKSNITEKIIGEDGETISIDDLRGQKIQEMATACNAAILSGFDIVLSDGISYHFSLEITDQMKISKLADRAASGDTLLPWHADDQICKFYPRADILAINTAMENLIEYHTTYFNSLKNYIKNINDKDTVADVHYGMEIPRQYCSEVLAAILEQMASTAAESE